MKNQIPDNQKSKPGWILRPLWIVAIHILIIAGVSSAALTFRNYWIFTLCVPLLSLFWLYICISRKNSPGFIVFSLLSGISLGITLWLVLQPDTSREFRNAFTFLCFAGGFFGLWIFSRKINGNVWWWPVLPAFISLGASAWLFRGNLDILDIIFFFGTAIGVGLLFWGIGQKLFGLIIAGCLTLTIAPGIYFSWKWIVLNSILSQIGIMLVWFALGWGLITITSRVINDKFNWWALIPGGVLAMVGLGLYLGGDPMIAEAVLSNSGVMGVILLAVYLTLMRTRFKQK